MLIKFVSSPACNNFPVLSGNYKWPLPVKFGNLASCRIPMTKRTAASSDVFKWANSEAGDSSTSAGSLSLTPNFILPVERRPNLANVSKSGQAVPVIDLGRGQITSHQENQQLVEEIARACERACEEYGLFLIVNHGVPEGLCQSMLTAVTDLFHLPSQMKSQLVSNDPNKDVRICNHYRKVEDQDNQEGRRFSMWSEVFKHPWHPVDDSFACLLPSDPPNYRRVMTTYAKEIGSLMSQLLSLMSQGLGLDGDYLQNRLGKDPLFRAQANCYPPCPEPDLTLGLGVHTDRDALTVVLPSPDVEGLQIMKDEKWIAVDAIPNAFVVNLGDQLQVLSNGKYKSVLHRVVTNKSLGRVSLAMFYGPDKDAVIGPSEHLIDKQHPPLYRNYYFREFLQEYRKQEGKNRKIKEFFEIQG